MTEPDALIIAIKAATALAADMLYITMDEADIANDYADQMIALKLLEAQRRAIILPGDPGECDLCGEPSLRLINMICARCRDKRKMP